MSLTVTLGEEGLTEPSTMVDPVLTEVIVTACLLVLFYFATYKILSTIRSILLRVVALSELNVIFRAMKVLFWHFHPFLSNPLMQLRQF